MPKCLCNKNFNIPKGRRFNWEEWYCNKECWRKSIEYRYRKMDFLKIFRSIHSNIQEEVLENIIRTMPLDYYDEVYYWVEEINEEKRLRD